MRAVIQRVSEAKVSIGESDSPAERDRKRSIGRGFVILLGVGRNDGRAQADRLWAKARKLRVFEDGHGKANLSLADVGGEVMVVSQFTLYANCRKGNRPSFIEAGEPEAARELYLYFLDLVRRDMGHVACGEFGADMRVELTNDGPCTILLDTEFL